MSTSESPSEQRRADILSARAGASRLIEQADHQDLRELACMAMRDLDEAERWLQQPNADVRPAVLELADLNIWMAIRRLAGLNDWLRKYGPGADAIRG